MIFKVHIVLCQYTFNYVYLDAHTLYAHTYTHIYTHIHTHIHTYTHTYTYTYTHTYSYSVCNLPSAPLSIVSTYTWKQQGDGLSRLKSTFKTPLLSSIVEFVVKIIPIPINQETHKLNIILHIISHNIIIIHIYYLILENHSKLHIKKYEFEILYFMKT